ncbi:MAG: hypothetical protein K0S39_3888 [Paenibacillus sp.]|jgi:hypothetical protein|nr:hypothetical protein [Paenibacillus sp.]
MLQGHRLPFLPPLAHLQENLPILPTALRKRVFHADRDRREDLTVYNPALLQMTQGVRKRFDAYPFQVSPQLIKTLGSPAQLGNNKVGPLSTDNLDRCADGPVA